MECPTDGMLAHKRERLHDVVRPTPMPEAEAMWAAPCIRLSMCPRPHMRSGHIFCKVNTCLMGYAA